MSYKEDTKRFDEMNKLKVKCKCGHSEIIIKSVDRKICSWCKHWVYRTPQIEFKYKIKEKMLRKGKTENVG